MTTTSHPSTTQKSSSLSACDDTFAKNNSHLHAHAMTSMQIMTSVCTCPGKVVKYGRSAAAAATARLIFLPSDLLNKVHLFSTAPNHYFFESLEEKETNVTQKHSLK